MVASCLESFSYFFSGLPGGRENHFSRGACYPLAKSASRMSAPRGGTREVRAGTALCGAPTSVRIL